MLHAILDYQRPKPTHFSWFTLHYWLFLKNWGACSSFSQLCVVIFTLSRLFGARRHPPSFSHLLDFSE